MSFPIEHQPQNQQFTATIDGHPAELAYSLPAPGLIDFSHTFVDEALRGRGVADAMAREALTYARQQNLRVRTSCTFMAGFVDRHPEYKELLDKQA